MRHASKPGPALVVAALPATPDSIGTKKQQKIPRRRLKGLTLDGVSLSPSEPLSDPPHCSGSISELSSREKTSLTSISYHGNGRPSINKARAGSENGVRTRRSTGRIRELVPDQEGLFPKNGSSAPPSAAEEKVADGEKFVGACRRGRKRRRQFRNKDAGAPVDERTRITRRLRAMVNRIRQEQNLLDAYAGEGWKGQSREKIRPEKELQRAEMQILMCKLAIRDLIHDLDNLARDGSLQKSAFDEDGQIFHEEIFCAKCKSQETSPDNDIILCDGACDRGFHQQCVDPPLATADIPPDDEGWLCPVCESKVDSLNYMNDFLGTDYQVEDQWQKVFASAAAVSDRASKPLGEEWPSEDSDDDDYDPDRRPIQGNDYVEQENSGRSTLRRAFSDLNLLHGSGSEPEASSGSGSGSDSSDVSGSLDHSGDEVDRKEHELRSRRGRKGGIVDVDLPSDFPGAIAVAEAEEVLSVSGRRYRNPVDYKRLHQEMFGEHDDDMLSDDEEWGPGGPSRRGKRAEGLNGVAKRPPIRPASVVGPEVRGITPLARLKPEEGNMHYSAENRKARRYPDSAAKVLREEFESGNRFPTRNYKEVLSQRLGLSFMQVSSWFKTARHVKKHGIAHRSQRNKGEVCVAGNGVTIDINGVDEMELTNGLLVEKLDDVQMKLHHLKQTLEAMMSNRDAGLHPNGKHIVYIPVAEVVEKDLEVPVVNVKF